MKESKSGVNCIFVPNAPNGDRSRMFLDLMDKKKEFRYTREQAIGIYVIYTKSNAKEKMEAIKNADGSPKYHINSQGEFPAKDVVDYLGIDKQMEEINNFDIEEYRLGAVDSIGGKRIDYTDAEEVLNKVNDFNNSHTGLVAGVEQHTTSDGIVYNIKVYAKDAGTIDVPVSTRERLKAWEIYKQVFNANGIDITSMPEELKDIFSAYNINLGKQLRNFSKLDIDNIYRKDALILFTIDADSKEVQRLIGKFGSIENAAQALDDFNHKTVELDNSQRHLLAMAISHAKKLHGIDVEALIDQINQMTFNVEVDSPEVEWKEEIDKLNKKFHIFKGETRRINDDIDNVSQAYSEIIIQLKRKMTALHKEKGVTEEGKELKRLYNKLQKELAEKKHYKSIVDFLKLATNDIEKIEEEIKNVSLIGDSMEVIMNKAHVLKQYKDVENQYRHIVSMLALDNMDLNDIENQEDIDTIKEIAQKLKTYFENKEGVIKKLTKQNIYDMAKLMSKGKISDSELNDMLEKSLQSVGWTDRWLNSVGTAKNLLINVAGTVMRNQEIMRDQAMEDVKVRINIANARLKKAGFNSEFMYEDEKHIISDINWEKFDAAKEDEKKRLKRNGLRGFDLEQAMNNWEYENTEDRLVDKENGRKERVPNENYRKVEDFQKDWAPAQKEYYDTIMQIKGELESNYPAHAQNYYYPPQIRRTSMDAFLEAGKSFNTKGMGKAILNKLKDPFVIREDDTNFIDNAVVDGERTTLVEGDYDNTPKKRIPIFFQNQVEDGELLRDFSSGIIHLASSAINYAAMSEIEDMMYIMADFADHKDPATPKSMVEISDSRFNKVIKDVYNFGRTNNIGAVLHGFIDQHIYGIKRNPNENKVFTKFCDSIIKYTSFKGLATNLPGMFANGAVGVLQIFIDAGSNEFFGYKDMAWAFTKLFGDTGVKGDMSEYLSNNTSSKGTLLQKMFDPMQENFEKASNKRYYNSFLRHFISKDFSYAGYGVGEYFIHMLPMYAILKHEKVKLNGKEISLYEAFDVTEKKDDNAELIIKEGVTDLDGNAITKTYLDKIRGMIMYANQSMHGAMNAEDKGLIHQYCMGRLVMNFRQWMVGHYSRRYRGRHFDFTLGEWREGYWVSVWKGLFNDDTKDTWKSGHKKDAILMFMKDCWLMMTKAQTQWNNLSEMQRYNVKRARAEIIMWISLLGLSFVLGEEDDHKKEWFRRWWIYQTKRMLTETEASMPGLKMPDSIITIVQSPIASVNTLNSLLYVIYGLTNGDLFEEIQSGKHKGENRYWRNVVKYDLPFYKDWEKLVTLDEDDSLFKVFDSSPSNH